MPPDCYKVKVVYFINPYLIWTEVCDPTVVKDEYVFEQVGVYGVLPLDTTLDIENEVIKTQKCDDWITAAGTLMKNVLADTMEVWFSPTYIDRRTSIFDDNIHKYGELIIKYKNGDLKHLSKLLIKSNLAHHDVCEFHKKLSSGEIKTKLNTRKTQEVVREIEKYYTRMSTSKNKCTKSIKKQTTVFRLAQDIESALTVSNLEKHNNEMLNKMLESKMRDLELCKDIDEESVGRGFVKSKESSKNESQIPMPAKESDNQEECVSQAFKNLKKLLDATAKVRSDKQSTVIPEAIKSSAELKNSNEMTNFSKKFSMNQMNREKMNMVRMKHKLSIGSDKEKSVNTVKPLQNNDNNDNNGRGIKSEANKTNVSTAFDNRKNLKKVAYGPPGLDPKHLKIVEAECDELDNIKDVVEVSNTVEEAKDDSESCQMFHDIDSEVSGEIANKKVFANYFNSIKSGKNRASVELKAGDDSNKSGEDSSEKQVSKSSLLQKKLRAYNNAMKHNTSYSSDTSNKDTSSVSDSNRKDDEEIQDVIRRIDEKYKTIPMVKNKEKPIVHSTETKLKNNVNPFKNIDPNLSVFVDKLVAPILMVHTKKNKRIQPVFEMRDVFFTSHIHEVLKMMSFNHPMMVQSVSWNTILRGYSLFMISPPNSGKTFGYLPAVCRFISDVDADVGSVGPICIIVCATAKSVAYVEELAKMLLVFDSKVVACYAGIDDLHITTQLLNGCDLLISTPSALVRLFQNDIAIDLRRLSVFVFDDCERLASTYEDEIKYFLFKIKETIKLRANNELKVQFILASRVWCDFMGPLAKKTPDTVISFSAFQECVLYSKASTSVSFVEVDNKLDILLEFLQEIDESKRTVIVCKSDDEVRFLESVLKVSKHVLFVCNNDMTVHDLYNLSVAWSEHEDPLMGPILICCDGNLTHMNITDAHNLIHYSLPQLFSMFCKRFAVLNDNYPSIFKSENEKVKIKIILDGTNVEQLPKIMNFIKRCTNNVPAFLDKVCDHILKERDVLKANSFIPICDKLLILGTCPDFYNCQERHSILAEHDTPQDWMPKDGVITFKILHCHSAVLYSARLLTNIIDGVNIKYPQTYSSLSLKMGLYYSKESNRRLHGIPQIGDICAASKKLNFFLRCQVVKILNRYPNGNPNTLLINLIDEEKYELTNDIHLYHLPDELKAFQTSVVLVRLTNLMPKDKDVTFSNLACDFVRKTTNNDDLFLKGHIVLTLGNCVFVDTLEACQELTSLNETVVKHNIKQELLEKHAQLNPDHIENLERMCIESGINVKRVPEVSQSQNPVKNLPKGSWAYLESDELSVVYMSSAKSPDKFFVRLNKFESCVKSLLQDIKTHVDSYTHDVEISNLKEGDLVLAKFPDDSVYERARIDGLKGDEAVCFFVDQGDWKDVSLTNLVPITEKVINQLPFQAIECRLIGVQPPGSDWSDFSKNWFCDNCFEDEKGNLKLLYVKYYTKESAVFTNGYKYGVILIDTNMDQDVVINKQMIDLNLARENVWEKDYLDKLCMVSEKVDSIQNGDESEDDLFETSNVPQDTSDVEGIIHPLGNPIRSVPLVDSDSSDIDRWDVNIHKNDVGTLFPGFKSHTNDIKSQDLSTQHVEKLSITNTIIDEKTVKTFHTKETQELDSDDFTSSEISQMCHENERQNIYNERKSRPKLLWRQTHNIVFIKIELVAVQKYVLEIEARSLKFSSNVNDVDYEFKIDLYGVIDKDKCSHAKTGLYVMVKLVKVSNTKWISLTKGFDVKNWIVYDVDDIDTSSDEEEVNKSEMENIVRTIHDVESESDDDEFLDDLNR